MSYKDRIKEIKNKKKSLIKKISKEEIEAYKFIIDTVKNKKNKNNYVFRFVFLNFFKVKNFRDNFDDDWLNRYFQILENASGQNKIPSIKEVLEQLKNKNDKKVWFSYATKLIHTLDPKESPIYDSSIGKNLGIYPHGGKGDKIKKCIKAYTMLQCRYNEMQCQKGWKKSIECFKKQFPRNNVSNMKKIDFIIWKARKWKGKKLIVE